MEPIVLTSMPPSSLTRTSHICTGCVGMTADTKYLLSSAAQRIWPRTTPDWPLTSLAANRDLLESGTADLRRRRQEFAAELTEAVRLVQVVRGMATETEWLDPRAVERVEEEI